MIGGSGPRLETDTLVARALRAASVAGEHASAVDEKSRFPSEAITALRKERLLGVQVERALGGEQASLRDLSRTAYLLGQECASSAMIFAMHQSQIACLVHHWHGAQRDAFLRRAVEEQMLLASATSEKGGDGGIRCSGCALTEVQGRMLLEKQSPVISYGAQADAILVTARRAPTADSQDQVLVLLADGCYELRQVSEWNALGMRGTCSAGYTLRSTVDRACVLDDPFADILARTMLPIAHILWASVWLGIATDAVRRARDHARQMARRGASGIKPSSILTRLQAAVAQTEAGLVAAIHYYDGTRDITDEQELRHLAVEMNCLKVAASENALHIISDAMNAVGLPAYLNNTSSSLGRHLRDIYSAVAMVHNERLCSDTFELLLVTKSRSQLLAGS